MDHVLSNLHCLPCVLLLLKEAHTGTLRPSMRQPFRTVAVQRSKLVQDPVIALVHCLGSIKVFGVGMDHLQDVIHHRTISL